MVRRPLCLVCLLLMAAMYLAECLGFPLISGNPLPQSVQKFILQHPKAVICGEVQRCQDTEFSQSVYLKQVFLLSSEETAGVSSEKIPIENVRVFLKKSGEIPSGALLLVSGKLEPVKEPRNPGEFDSRQYYACQHIYYFLKDGVLLKKSANYSVYRTAVSHIRERICRNLKNAAGEDAPVLEAMVLGEKTDLDDRLKMKYQLAGIIHILAISGLHISLLGMGLFSLLKKAGLGNYAAGMLALIVMLQYGVLTGASVSAMRAVCMFLLSVFAKILGRIYDLLTALSVSAMMILLDSPAYLYSSSFLLSFGAVLGIGAAAPCLCEALHVKNKLLKSLLSSAAVQLTTLPVLLWCYGEVSVLGVFLNLAVLPTVSIVLASGVACGLLGFFQIGLAGAAAIPGRAVLGFYEFLCSLAGRIPFCTWVGGAPRLWQIACYYGVLVMVLLSGKWISEKTKNRKTAGICCAALITAGILFLGHRPEQGLRITCLDVGQGDGCVLETPEGQHILIDCGSSSQSGVGQYQLLPYLKNQGISYLDAILVSHTDKDHISGIQELLEFMRDHLTVIRAGKLILPGWEEEPEAYQELKELAVQAGVETVAGNAGDVLQAGSVELVILAPERGTLGTDVNEDGLVAEIRCGEFLGVFTGDIGEETERKLLEKLHDVDFLKTAHHGSRYSTSEAFLQRTMPEIAVISCSSTNTYGHPSPETIERLEKAGCRIEYTMKSGAVSIMIQKGQMRLQRFVAS